MTTPPRWPLTPQGHFWERLGGSAYGRALSAKGSTEGALVEVEVDIGPGLPAFNIVGLPDAAVQEAKERVRAAVKNSGCVFPQRRITVKLAPADLKKEGPFRQTGRLGTRDLAHNVRPISLARQLVA